MTNLARKYEVYNKPEEVPVTSVLLNDFWYSSLSVNFGTEHPVEREEKTVKLPVREVINNTGSDWNINQGDYRIKEPGRDVDYSAGKLKYVWLYSAALFVTTSIILFLSFLLSRFAPGL